MSRIRRNLASLLLSQASTLVVSLVTLIVLPKYLGAQTYGSLAFAMGFVGFFAIASSLGSRPFLCKTIARDPTQLGVYVFNGLVFKCALAGFFSGFAIALAHLLGYSSQTIVIIEVACIGMVFAVVADVFSGALQGTERIGKIALWMAVQQYVSGAIAIVLLLDHQGVVIYALVIATGAVIPVLANGYQLWPEFRGTMKLDFRLWRAIALGGLPFFFWGAILLIYGSIDILMLEEITGSQTVGWYTLAYTWVGLPIIFPSVLVTVVFPALSSKASGSASEYSRVVNRALQLAVFVGTPMAIGIALTANNIIGLFHYPAGFEQTVPLIRILAIHIPIVSMDMVLAIALTAKDRQKAWVLVGCIAAIFNPAVNFLAIPITVHRFADGAIGASIVTVATEVVMMIGAIYLRPEGVLDRQTASFLLRCVVASLAMIPFVLLASSAPLAVKVMIGVTVFALTSFGLRLVSPREARDGAVQLVKSFRGGGRLAPVPTVME
jgi:O-antigen/teichoic acid export membrane protein